MEQWIAVVAFLTVALITPGPNNLLALDAGARGGLASAVPIIGAVIAGGLGLLALAWTGAGLAFEALPRLQKVLTIAGSVYLALLGVAMIVQTMRPYGTGSASKNPLPQTWLGVTLFQFVNPKAWVLMVTATASVAPNGWGAFAALAGTFTVLSGLCLALWTVAGSIVVTFLSDGRSRRWFDRALGGTLIASAGFLMSS